MNGFTPECDFNKSPSEKKKQTGGERWMFELYYTVPGFQILLKKVIKHNSKKRFLNVSFLT